MEKMLILILIYFAGSFNILSATEVVSEESIEKLFTLGDLKNVAKENINDYMVKAKRSVKAAPNSLDWREKGLVTAPKNQLSCEAGWAFAIIGAIEGQYAKLYGNLVDFSAQELVDCMYECSGCQFCKPTTALNSLVNLGGVEEDTDYQYVGKKQSCKYKPALSRVRMTKFYTYERIDENYLKNILAEKGPLYIAVDGTSLKLYKNGILEKCPCKNINHALLLVGYGSENGVDYWIVKNSRGALWGEKGFARIRRGVNACGLTYSPAHVVVEKNT